jgi:hypothetical protein
MKVQSFSEWINENKCGCTGDGQPRGPRGMVKISHKEKIMGARDLTDDLSSDYQGHIGHNGEVAPFKVMGKKGKAVAESTGSCGCDCGHCSEKCCGGEKCCDACTCCKK